MAGDTEFMDVFVAASFVGVHVQTLRRLARGNKIPCFKVGRDWRFRKEALVQWADEQRRGEGLDYDRRSVLVVDDEAGVGAALTRMLGDCGCATRYAASGAAGLALIEQAAPDLVLLDLMMPNMNGPQFLEKLRRTHPHLPAIIVTGYPNGELMKKALRFAPLMVLAKPIERQALERTIQMLFGDRTASSAAGSEP